MSRAHKFFKYWLPVLLWMAVIFSASADSKSGPTSSRLIGPVVRFFVPNISEERLGQVVFVVRKAAHVTEYAVLSWLLARALATSVAAKLRMVLLLAFLLAAAYAASDEWHQAFVPNRDGKWADVGLDSFGALLGVIAFYWFGRVRGYWSAQRIK